uniref:Uncharacterized protein n=1 Tax=Knipowitschia caucasica TaxID=637954 RepID=A0AAV2MH80_KNICA
MTFVSPENMETQCCREAFAGIVEQLELAKTNCTDPSAHINGTLDSLHFYSDRCPQSVQTNSSDCKWEKQRGGKTLVELVGDIESFLQLLNTMQSLS